MKIRGFILASSIATLSLLLPARAVAFDCYSQCLQGYWACMGVPPVQFRRNGDQPGTGVVGVYEVCLSASHACYQGCDALAAGARDAPEDFEEFSKDLSALLKKFPELSGKHLFFPRALQPSE